VAVQAARPPLAGLDMFADQAGPHVLLSAGLPERSAETRQEPVHLCLLRVGCRAMTRRAGCVLLAVEAPWGMSAGCKRGCACAHACAPAGGRTTVTCLARRRPMSARAAQRPHRRAAPRGAGCWTTTTTRRATTTSRHAGHKAGGSRAQARGRRGPGAGGEGGSLRGSGGARRASSAGERADGLAAEQGRRPGRGALLRCVSVCFTL